VESKESMDQLIKTLMKIPQTLAQKDNHFTLSSYGAIQPHSTSTKASSPSCISISFINETQSPATIQS
jgi:hypothetical protein